MQDVQGTLAQSTLVPKFRGPHRIWSDEEMQYLQFHWGSEDLGDIAKALSRTPEAVVMKARELELGSAQQGVVSLRGFSRKSGYSLSKIWAAVEALGLKIRRARRSEAWQKRRITWFAISDEQQEQLLEYMLEHEVIHKVPPRTPGAWGEGKKPPACLRCERSSKPHYAKGYCASCYQAKLKEQKQVKSGHKDGEGKPSHGKHQDDERRCDQEREDRDGAAREEGLLL